MAKFTVFFAECPETYDYSCLKKARACCVDYGVTNPEKQLIQQHSRTGGTWLVKPDQTCACDDCKLNDEDETIGREEHNTVIREGLELGSRF